ncbi:MAG: cyclic nucleotide-binding domain-containing protein [Deltaproteobacteria bacterium]|nr:cyclic nucleotide-binding domain-containing protein [Deltaproteobacteria bacterium]
MYGFNIKKFEQGEIIFKEGVIGNNAYVIKSGSVEISKNIKGKKVAIAALKQGEVFGEMALLEDGQERTATVTALEDSELVEISREKFLEFLDKSPRIIATLLNTLVDRLKKTTAKLSETQNPFLAAAEVLYIVSYNNLRSIEYAPVLKSISNILAIPQISIERIFKKMVDLELIDIIESKNTGRAIVLKNRMAFLAEAKNAYLEIGDSII